MADNKKGRDKQAHDAENRQRERELAEELERGDESEPEVEITELAQLETELDSLDFPLTGTELVTEVGEHEIDSDAGTYSIEALIPETDEQFDSPAAVSVQVQRPTIAATMKRILEASNRLPHTNLSGSQRNAYEKTFRELKDIDADDDDEGIQVIGDWIVEQIRDKERLPRSRAVRREAAKFCRTHDYQIRNDQWLGI